MEPYWKSLCVQRYENIRKAECDTNLYRGLVLVNEMKVLLISNPKTLAAACTLSVNVGSFSDPYDLPGLAHLCERMLVLGSQNYPSHKGFYKFLSDHDGNYHGTTTTDQTYYYFEIDARHLKDALLQYVHFFLTPLFKEDWVEEEINSLDSDHRELLMDDYSRLTEFIKFTAHSNHPYWRFAFGNRRSLKTIPEQCGINVRSRLLDFYEKYYSANIMSLCVFTDEPLDKIEEMVVNLFCMIPNKKIKIPLRHEHPYKDQFCTAWYIIPKDDMKFLKIVFPLPGIHDDYWVSALNFIIMLMAYDGEGSLSAFVKKSGLFYDITIFRQSCARGINFLMLDIFLTENGIMYVNAFIDLLFEYLNMVKNKCNMFTSSDQLLLKLYEIFINQVMDYNSKTAYYDYENTYDIAGMLRLYPMEKILLKGRPDVLRDIAWECNQDIINWILNNYVSPQNIRVYILAEEYESETTDIGPEWCDGAKYREQKIPEERISSWKNVSHSRFRLPSLDEFMAQYES